MDVCFNWCNDDEIYNRWINSVICTVGLPIHMAAYVPNTAARVVASVASILSFGKWEAANRVALDGFGRDWHDLGGMMVRVHACLLNSVNPKSENKVAKDFEHGRQNKAENPNGWLSSQYAIPLLKKAKECAQEQKLAEARGNYLLGTLVLAATKIIEFAIGIICGVLAYVTVGMIPVLNDFATQNLSAFDGLLHMLTGIRAVINPEQSHLGFGAELEGERSELEDVDALLGLENDRGVLSCCFPHASDDIYL